MRAVVQRVRRAVVRVDTVVVGSIGSGLAVLVGIGPADTDATARHLAERVATLRIFADDTGRMNRALEEGGEVLVVSQFTLFGDVRRGHRPAFTAAAAPAHAERLYRVFAAALRERGLRVATGEFGAHMELETVNDGPVTLVLTSGEPAWDADAG